ncbi:acyl-CoA dehydrogenase family protein [Flavobacteriales bacterium]|nr:acyl-CoA dehydrogenase family protein [bacterium]MDA8771455.1 acyl-CoA dehydrogenase family protein [Flavobacteriales bacterium]
MSDQSKALRGGEFLIRETTADAIFIPEEWTEEQLMMKQMTLDFVEQRIIPNLERIEQQEEGLVPQLMEEAGELGLIGSSVPEELGGMGLDFKSTMLITEAIGGAHSFSVSFSAHTGIGTLPILYYGNDAQKKQWIPGLASGQLKGCYCLTEPSAGSDANNGKTTAKLTEDGKHYLINGQKMWITNGGFADVMIVFAKIDDDENLTAFIIDGHAEGISKNPEEKKMGIKGSSTRQIFFNDVQVPVENLLYARQKGFKIAVNILNIGRIKLGGAVLGAAKDACTHAVRYANEREQFGRPISKYGAIRYKLAESAIRLFTKESALYRATQNIDDAIAALKAGGMEHGEATLKGIADFAPECAMMKVLGSEVLDYVVDETVQIHGGMGYSAETRAELAYRDARINRIFEGTNEINRMLTVDMILKKAMKGEIDLMTPAMAISSELTGVPDMTPPPTDLFEKQLQYVRNFKKAILMVAGSAAQKLMMSLAKEQEILMNIADMAIWAYTAESTILRVQKLRGLRGNDADLSIQEAIMRVYTYQASEWIHSAGKEALLAFAEGDELKMMLMGMKRFAKTEDFNTKEARQLIAMHLIEKNEYGL